MQNEIEKGGGWRSRWKGVFVPFFISFSFFTDRRWDKEAVGDALRTNFPLKTASFNKIRIIYYMNK